MGKIDEELLEAMRNNEIHEVPAPVVLPKSDNPAGRPGKDYRLLFTLLGIVGSILLLVAYLPPGAFAWAVTVDQLLAHPDEYQTRTLNLQGQLVSGSMLYRKVPCEYRFRLAGASQRDIEIHYPSCVLPDTVRDMKGEHIDVTATGKLAASGEFVATQVAGKCPSKEGYKQRTSRPRLIAPVPID